MQNDPAVQQSLKGNPVDPVRATSDEQRSALRSGAIPAVEEVRPGVFAIPLDMPGMQPSYAFSYAILARGESRDVHIVDAGLDTDANWEAFREAILGLDRTLSDIASVTVTHLHFDHTGLANRIREASGAIVRMHADEAAAVRDGLQFSAGEDVAGTLVKWGVPEEERAELLAIATSRADFGSIITIDEEVTGGDTLDFGGYEGLVIHTPGHTSGHVCISLVGENAVFTGDHVLPVINPGIALGGKRAADPLGEYYESLERLSPFAEAEALPGHGFRFRPLGARCAEIRAHHEARTALAAERLAVEPDLSVWELASRLSWTGGWDALPAVSRVSALAQTDMHAVRVRAASLTS